MVAKGYSPHHHNATTNNSINEYEKQSPGDVAGILCFALGAFAVLAIGGRESIWKQLREGCADDLC